MTSASTSCACPAISCYSLINKRIAGRSISSLSDWQQCWNLQQVQFYCVIHGNYLRQVLRFCSDYRDRERPTRGERSDLILDFSTIKWWVGVTLDNFWSPFPLCNSVKPGTYTELINSFLHTLLNTHVGTNIHALLTWARFRINHSWDCYFTPNFKNRDYGSILAIMCHFHLITY